MNGFTHATFGVEAVPKEAPESPDLRVVNMRLFDNLADAEKHTKDGGFILDLSALQQEEWDFILSED